MKDKKPSPLVEVVRKPAAAPARAGVRPGVVTPRPVPKPQVAPVRPASAAPAAAAPGVEAVAAPPAAVPPSARPSFGSRPPGGPGGRSGPGGRPGGFRPARPPGPPPTAAQIEALAKKERVPARIAKGELEGKMKARVWKKLHREEAGRFDQAYQLMEKHPTLPLAEAFGVIQSGLGVEDFVARRARAKKKEEVKTARSSVTAEAIDAYVAELVGGKTELTVVLAERTVLDLISKVEPVAFQLERSGRLEKLQVVCLAPRGLWEPLVPTLERDPKLAQKPAPVARQPAKRPVSDPRPFLEHLGKEVSLVLRNGTTLRFPLQAVGPFDLLVGPSEVERIFVPLHAIVEWSGPKA